MSSATFNLAVGEAQHMRNALGPLVVMMGHENQTRAGLGYCPVSHVKHFPALLGVQTLARFIKNEQTRSLHGRARQQHEALLAKREFAKGSAGFLLQVNRP